MRKNNAPKKLTLNRETLRKVTGGDPTDPLQGQGPSGGSTCIYSVCGTCPFTHPI